MKRPHLVAWSLYLTVCIAGALADWLLRDHQQTPWLYPVGFLVGFIAAKTLRLAEVARP